MARLSSTQRFLRIQGLFDGIQWFVIHAAGIGMNAWLMFFIELHIQSRRLKIDVVDLDYHVWPGTGQGQLMTALEGQKSSIMSAAQIFAGTLTTLLPSEADDIYLLPGNQTGSRLHTPDIRAGDAINDVTIVLENPTTAPPSIWQAVTSRYVIPSFPSPTRV